MCLVAKHPILTWSRASRNPRHPPCTVREVGRYQFIGVCLWGLAALPPMVAGFPAGGPSLPKVRRQFNVIPRTTKCRGEIKVML